MGLKLDAEWRVKAWVTENNPRLPLDLSCMKLTQLPPIPPTVERLWCFENKLERLEPLPPNLLELCCDNNHLTELPALPIKLHLLDCRTNELVRLPELPESLRTLFCSRNKLVELPDLPPQLADIDCSRNQLTMLPDFVPPRLDNYQFDSNLFRNAKRNELINDFVASINEEERQRRTFKRTIMFREELLAVTWAPSRPNFGWWFKNETGVNYE